MDSPLPDGTIIENAALITDTQDITDTDEITTVVESSHTLVLAKTATPDPVEAGARLTYTLAYTVTGNETALGVTLSDTVPANTAYQTCSGGLTCDESGGVVTWDLGDQAPGASGTVTFTVNVDSPLPDGTIIENTALITDTQDITDTDDITTVVESSHTLVLAKTATPDPVQAGARLTYTLEWSVSGNETALGVTISDTVPVSTTYQDCGPVPCDIDTGVITWTLGDRDPDESGTVTFTVNVDSPLPDGTVIENTP